MIIFMKMADVSTSSDVAPMEVVGGDAIVLAGPLIFVFVPQCHTL